jgi:hypothetical protein
VKVGYDVKTNWKPRLAESGSLKVLENEIVAVQTVLQLRKSRTCSGSPEASSAVKVSGTQE